MHECDNMFIDILVYFVAVVAAIYFPGLVLAIGYKIYRTIVGKSCTWFDWMG